MIIYLKNTDQILYVEKPNLAKLYVSYFINQDEQTVEQHTVECDKTGFYR